MNPEFKRQCWLELGLPRLLLLALSLGALFVLMAFIDHEAGTGVAMPTVALITFVALCVAMGGQRAGDAVLAELRDQTWDTQRLSALSPWPMTWGKWLGATSFTWLGGLVCLLVFMSTAQQLPAATVKLISVQALAGALFVQGLSLIGALAIAGQPKRLKGPLGARLIAVICGLAYAYLAFRLGSDEIVKWYGQQVQALIFSTALLVATTLWIVVGAYRLMCDELQVPVRPWLWPLFLLYCTFVISGLFVEPIANLATLRVVAATGLMCALAAAYLCAFTLFRDPLVLRRIWRYAFDGHWRRAFEESPLWLCSLAVALVWATLGAGLGDRGALINPVENISLAAIPLFLYAVRDMLILLAASNSARPERAEIATMIYLGLLYWLVPALLEMLGLDAMSLALRPKFWIHPGQATGILLVQIVACASWAYYAYRLRAAPRFSSTQ